MDARVILQTRRADGTIVRREREVTAESLRIGRGSDNEIHLADPRVRLHFATIHPGAGDGKGAPFIQAEEGATFGHGGAETAYADLAPGAEIALGPYLLTIGEPDRPDEPDDLAHKDITLTIELVHPPSDADAVLRANSRTSFDALRPRTRLWSWLLLLVVLGAGLAWPVAEHMRWLDTGPSANAPMQAAKQAGKDGTFKPAEIAWLSGEISDAHKFFAADCGACHVKPFERVQDSACAACHANITHHADPAEFDIDQISTALCQSCHTEHKGAKAIVRADQALCADCHGALQARAPQTTLADAASFDMRHPPFRPAVVVDGESGRTERMTLDKARESSNLKFPHDVHLKPGGLKIAGSADPKILGCGDCHATEPGGTIMRPIKMEEHCIECHQLRFDDRDPERTLPHGAFERAQDTIADYYMARALESDASTPGASSRARLRRIPGRTLNTRERASAIRRAESRIAQTMSYAFGQSKCGACHEISRRQGTDATGMVRTEWTLKKVRLAERWLHKGRFDHKSHENTECGTCHQAAGSKQATDVLLPGIDTCRACHGGAEASAKLPSTCIMCHDFHLPRLSPMRESAGRAAGPPGRS